MARPWETPRAPHRLHAAGGGGAAAAAGGRGASRRVRFAATLRGCRAAVMGRGRLLCRSGLSLIAAPAGLQICAKTAIRIRTRRTFVRMSSRGRKVDLLSVLQHFSVITGSVLSRKNITDAEFVRSKLQASALFYDAVPEQSGLLKLRRKPAFEKTKQQWSKIWRACLLQKLFLCRYVASDKCSEILK